MVVWRVEKEEDGRVLIGASMTIGSRSLRERESESHTVFQKS